MPITFVPDDKYTLTVFSSAADCVDAGNPPGCEVECTFLGDNPQCNGNTCSPIGWCAPGGGCVGDRRVSTASGAPNQRAA